MGLFFAKTFLRHLLSKKGLGPGAGPDLRAGVEELVPVDLQHGESLSHFGAKSTQSHVPIGGPRCLIGHCPRQHPGFDHEVAQVQAGGDVEHDHRDLPWPRDQPADESAFLAPPQKSS